jgi:hypothetical protein
MHPSNRLALLLFAGAGVVAVVGGMLVASAFATLGPPPQTPATRLASLQAAVGSNPGAALLGYLILTALLVLCVKAAVGHPKMHHHTGQHLAVAAGLAATIMVVVMAVVAFGVGFRCG